MGGEGIRGGSVDALFCFCEGTMIEMGFVNGQGILDNELLGLGDSMR